MQCCFETKNNTEIPEVTVNDCNYQNLPHHNISFSYY